jgi:hypothetical protein
MMKSTACSRCLVERVRKFSMIHAEKKSDGRPSVEPGRRGNLKTRRFESRGW